jgi:ribonucleoside-diphosphate reductase alpha chain
MEIKLTPNALIVLKQRGYLVKRGDKFESPEEMFRRAARIVAAPDLRYRASVEEVSRTEERFFEMMASFKFLAGTVLLNAGRPQRMFSACFVLPVDDSLGSIFETMKNAALVSRMGGGLGISFSRLRSRGSLVKSTGGASSGPVSYLGLYNQMGQVINEACSRRVAMLATLRVDHPDVIEFITAKKQSEALTNFNLSVSITNEFIKTLKRGGKYKLIDPHTQQVVKEVYARETWELIAQTAWKSADPGLLFIDTINEANPTPHLGEIESTNVCGENPLLPYESCNLGNINLAKVVKSNQGKSAIDWEELAGLVRDGVHFLDNVIDVCEYPLVEIDRMSRKTRKVGVGVMGWADLLIKLGVPYNSDKAIKLGEKLARFIQEEARQASVELGKKRGSFPAFAGSCWEGKFPAMRNATVNSVAPTGTISIIANCSSGIEPIFALAYLRKNLLDLGTTEMVEVNIAFEQVARQQGFYSEELIKAIRERGNVQDLKGIPEKVKKVFVTAHDVSWQWHVKMQAGWQKYVDLAVSKTINLPSSAAPEDVADAFLMAYETGCKGVTVYRDRSKGEQVLNISKSEKNSGQGDEVSSSELCPECSGRLEIKEGCRTCPNCSYSYCLS